MKIYDGTELNSNQAEIVTGSLVLDHQIILSTNGIQLNVGISNNYISTLDIVDSVRSVLHNYDVIF